MKSIWKTDRCKGEIYMRLKANLFALKHIKANDFLNLHYGFYIFAIFRFYSKASRYTASSCMDLAFLHVFELGPKKFESNEFM